MCGQRWQHYEIAKCGNGFMGLRFSPMQIFDFLLYLFISEAVLFVGKRLIILFCSRLASFNLCIKSNCSPFNSAEQLLDFMCKWRVQSTYNLFVIYANENIRLSFLSSPSGNERKNVLKKVNALPNVCVGFLYEKEMPIAIVGCFIWAACEPHSELWTWICVFWVLSEVTPLYYVGCVLT